MKNLIYKEFRLCMNPLLYLYFIAAFMLLIPGYMYLVSAFFLGNAIFNSMQLSNANSDVLFTAMLPVSKNTIVKAKYLFVVCLQMIMIALFVVMMFMNHLLIKTPNPGGIDACPAMFLGFFCVYALFNATFLPLFYKNVNKIGRAFLISLIIVFAFILLFEGFFIAASAAKDSVPFFAWIANNIDCWPPAPNQLGLQLGAALLGAAIYAVTTLLSYKASCRHFDKVDI